MNKLALLALAVSLPILGAHAADSKAAPAAPAPKQQKLLKVSTLKTAEANREFQANIQLLQAQRQAAIQLNTEMEKETDAAKKKTLKGQLDALMAKLNENNEKMRNAYGFSLDRNYTLEIETAHVYMLVTDEEAAKIEASQKAAATKK
jgi:uncharacterized FlaG/YvyC family protein